MGELRHKQVPDHGEKHVTAINRDIADLEEHQVNYFSEFYFIQ